MSWLGPPPPVNLAATSAGLHASMIITHESRLMAAAATAHGIAKARTIQIESRDRGPGDFDLPTIVWAFEQAGAIGLVVDVELSADLAEGMRDTPELCDLPGALVVVLTTTADHSAWLSCASNFARVGTPIQEFLPKPKKPSLRVMR